MIEQKITQYCAPECDLPYILPKWDEALECHTSLGAALEEDTEDIRFPKT